MMKQLTKKSLLLIPITLCGLVLSGCGQSSNDDIGSVHTSISNTKHHDSAEKNDTKSKHKSHKDDDSDKVTDNKKDKEKESDKSKNQSHKHHKTESASSLKDKNKDKDSDNNSNNDVKDETKNQDNKTAANGNNTSNNKNNDTVGQSNNNNGDNQVYTAEQDNQKFMNTKPDKVLPPVNTSTPQQPADNSEDSQGKTTYKITGGGQAQQDDRKVNVSGNTASYNGESISANDFNTAKNYFESKKLDEPDYIYFEWAKYAKDHKCSLDDAYKQNINMVN